MAAEGPPPFPGPAMLQDRRGLEEGQVWLPLLSFRPHPSSSLFRSAFTFFCCHVSLDFAFSVGGRGGLGAQRGKMISRATRGACLLGGGGLQQELWALPVARALNRGLQCPRCKSGGAS